MIESRTLWRISAELEYMREMMLDMNADDQTIEDTLAVVAMEWREKALNVVAFIRHLESDAAADSAKYAEYKKDIDRIKKSADAKTRRAKKLRSYLAAQMEREGVARIENDRGPPISLTRRTDVELIDEAVPNEYTRTKTEIDRIAAKKAARELGDCNWAIVVSKPILRI